MRARSKKQTGKYTLYAVSDTNAVLFAIDFRGFNNKGYWGFSVERIDQKNGVRKYMDGFKLFKELDSKPRPDKVVSTYAHPVQSVAGDDFTCAQDTEYEYLFHPDRGKAKAIDRSLNPVSIIIRTEPLFSNQEHDIFFNRGVTSSQAFRRKFFNLRPIK